MLGPKQEAQAALFYEFSLEDHVPQDHLLRSIDQFVDLRSIRAHLADFYSHTGRPSVDPELLIRMLLVGYCFGIRSERRLCEEVHLNLAYRWFCRLDLNDRIPDHSTFSKNRHGRFCESELLRHLFETTVARCITEGLVSGQRMAVDASLIEADANRQCSAPKEEWDPARIDVGTAPRAVREYLNTLDEAAFGAASEVQPKFTSFSDPASQWTAARKGPAFFSYSDNYLIDTDHGVIVDVEATRSIRQAEVGSTKTMLNRVRAKFDLHPERLIADTAYGSGPMLDWLVKRKITREEHEDARDVARAIRKTRQYKVSSKLRKKVEMLFAHLKRILGLGRLRLRGPCGANDEFLLAAAAQNLRKLAKIFPAPQQTRKA
ncbi:IS5 family transposase [Yoonia sp. R2-816]|uniref:IS5 family transposase n=1 Tax=Yoonia sp. R2-816 TaxID=3342638 RepID=UPI003726590E